MKKKIFILFFLFTAILAWFIHFYVPKFVVEINNPIIETARTNFYDSHLNPESQMRFEKISYKGTGDIQLNANFFASKTQPPKATVILVHGIRSSKEENTPVAEWLARNGYNAVAVDLRAHGESQGEYCTFGYYEKQDISKLIDYLVNVKNIDTTFGIWGHSLGGAISLQVMATDPRIRFGIIESTYADFETITRDYAKNFSAPDSELLNRYVLERAGEIADFDISAVNPIDYAPMIHQPVLMAHGTDDNNIKIKYAEKVYQKLNSAYKLFIPVAHAGHNDIHIKGGKKYFEKILEFMNKSIQ